MRKGWKYILFFLTGFILLVIFLMLFTQTSFFKEKAKIQLIKIIENQLNLDLEIEKIDGNLYKDLIIRNIRFSKNDSTIATFSSVQFNYNLIPLTKKIISVDSVIIKDPLINLWQKKDSTWNLNHYLKAKSKTIKKENNPFVFAIRVEHLSLKNGNISTSSFSKVIPSEIKDFNLIAGGSFQTNNTQIDLKKLELKTENPSIELINLSGIFSMNTQGIQLDSLLLITEGSDIDINGEFNSKENLDAKVDASIIDNNELSLFIPSIKLACSPSLKANFKTVNDSVSAIIELQYDNQSVVAEISFNSFSHLINKNEPIPYFAHLTFDNFKVENWINFENKQGLIDGGIQIEGSNLLNFKSPSTILADLNNSEYNNILFDTLTFNGVYSDDSINASLNVQSDFGDVHIIGHIWNISKTPEYDAILETSNFNLTAFVPKLKGTTINGNIKTKGSGFKGGNIVTQTNLNLSYSLVYNFAIDSLNAILKLQNLQLNIDSLQLYVPGAFATGEGTLSLDSLIIKSLIQIEIDSLTVLDSTIILPIEFESVKTITTLSGPISELKIGGDVEINNAEGYSVKLEKALAKYQISFNKDSLYLWVKTTANIVETGPTEWDTVKLEINYSMAEIDLDVQAIWKDTIATKFSSTIKTGDTLSIVVPKLEIKTLLSDFYMPDTMRASILKKEVLEIENFRIKDHARPDFIISANGTISTADTNHFELLVEQLDLAQLNRFIQKQDSLKGVLKTDIIITGTSANPKIKGTIDVNNPKFGNYGLTSLIANFNYINQNGFVEIKTPDLGDAFYTSFSAPFNARFDSLNFVFSPPDTFNASLILDSLQISQSLEKLSPDDSISGILHANIKASGDYKNPLFYGGIDLVNGYFMNKKLGINYNYIKTSVVFDGKKITLDSVYVQQEGGLISVTGEVEFDSTIIKGNIVSSSLTADADKFFITKHRNYEILIDAKTFIKTGENNPEFGGKIKVIRSDVFLPALISDEKNNSEKDIPMLVEALYSESDSLLLNSETETGNSKKEKIRTALLDNLTGRLNVEIPRNTWLKSDDMRIELRGDVDIVKTGPHFELFGNIDIVRGHYILYGKKLNLKESQIIFQGGEELDPNLNIVAEYIYRGSDKEKRYLELMLNGKLSEPEITFLLDGSEITETDGISIIVFGATSDEIGYSGQNGLISSVGSNAVASVLTSQLSKTLGTQLNLDMIEITSTANWQSAAFMVGKYITNDIFVMYQRGFGEVEGDEITPETITVEYELNEIIFLRLQSGSSKTSGMDVILKFEQGKRQ